MLKSIEISFPPLPEQQRIVGILDEAFDGIATAKANAERNRQNTRALFESHLQSVFTQRGEGWVETTIGEQIMLQRGFDITKEQQRPGDVPVVSSGGIKSFHDTAMVQPPGVVIGRKGTLGKVFYLENNFWPHKTFWPPISRQKLIAQQLDSLYEQTQRLESIYQQKLAALDELKKSLLHQAFTGEL